MILSNLWKIDSDCSVSLTIKCWFPKSFSWRIGFYLVDNIKCGRLTAARWANKKKLSLPEKNIGGTRKSLSRGQNYLNPGKLQDRIWFIPGSRDQVWNFSFKCWMSSAKGNNLGLGLAMLQSILWWSWITGGGWGETIKSTLFTVESRTRQQEKQSF